MGRSDPLGSCLVQLFMLPFRLLFVVTAAAIRQLTRTKRKPVRYAPRISSRPSPSYAASKRPLDRQEAGRVPTNLRGFSDLSRGGGGFDVSVVGESHYQESLEELAGGFRAPDQYINFDALLIPEPDNPYDANAVAVFSEKYQKLGYLSRGDALRYKRIFQALRKNNSAGRVRASLIGGTRDNPSLGVVIDLLGPDELVDRVDRMAKLEAVGNVDAICPHCDQPLNKKPGRKKKCPYCGEFIFVRTRPIDGQQVLVTEAQAKKIEEQWSIVHGAHNQ